MHQNKASTSQGTDDEKRPDKPDQRKNRKKTKVLLCGSVILDISLCILIIITICKMTSERGYIKRQSDLCMNCSHLMLYNDDDFRTYDVYEGNICCVKEGRSYSSMVERLAEKTLKQRLVSESRKYKPLHCEHERSSVIKLVGKQKNDPGSGSSRFPWLKWDLSVQTKSSIDTTKELRFVNDSFIVIGRTGVYQIYSQVVLHNKQSDEPSAYSTSTDRYYVHAVYKRHNFGHEERILGGPYTYYHTQDGETGITSYISSPLQLLKEDTIGVKVHDVNQVVQSEITNFFGVHLIQ